jgi:hypothetical protein
MQTGKDTDAKIGHRRVDRETGEVQYKKVPHSINFGFLCERVGDGCVVCVASHVRTRFVESAHRRRSNPPPSCSPSKWASARYSLRLLSLSVFVCLIACLLALLFTAS